MVLLIVKFGALLVAESFDDDGVRTWWLLLLLLPPLLPPLREVPLVVLVLFLLAAMLLLLLLFMLLLLPLLLLAMAPDDVREGFLFFGVGPLLLDMVSVRFSSLSPAGASFHQKLWWDVLFHLVPAAGELVVVPRVLGVCCIQHDSNSLGRVSFYCRRSVRR